MCRFVSKRLLLATPIFALAAAGHAATELTFEEVWRRVRAASPDATVLAEEQEAIAGEADQAHRLPNPEVGAELENVLGTGPYRAVDETEFTVQLSQVYERAAKRNVRRRLAETAGPVAEAELAVRLADLRFRTANAFTAALIAQQQVALRQEALDLAERTVETVQRQNEAGQASGIDLARIRVELSSAQVALSAAETTLAQARQALAAQWGARDVDFDRVVGGDDVPVELPELSALASRLAQTPDILRYDAIGRQREAVVAAEKAVNLRDVTISGGVRYFRDGQEGAFVVGVSVPILVHNRNQGAIRAAQARLRQVPLEVTRTKLTIQAELTERYAQLAAAHREVTALDRQVLPAALEVVRQNEASYAQGRVSLLQVLEAQRTLLDARERRLDAVSRLLQAQTTLDRLTRPPERLIPTSP